LIVDFSLLFSPSPWQRSLIKINPDAAQFVVGCPSLFFCAAPSSFVLSRKPPGNNQTGNPTSFCFRYTAPICDLLLEFVFILSNSSFLTPSLILAECSQFEF
jgi:hypothetical protein